MKKIFIIALLLAVNTAMLHSQLPQGFNYQAFANTSSGEVMENEDLKVIVKIRITSEQGPVLWEEQHEVTTENNGLFNIVVCGDDNLRTGGTIETIDLIPWTLGSTYLDLSIDRGGTVDNLGATQLRSVPYAMVSASTVQETNTLEIQPGQTVGEGEPLFIVKRSDGYPIFGVYEDGVRVFTDDRAGKGAKGGFAVGGYNTNTKGMDGAYLTISPDSARIYVNDVPGKGAKGGFAVGGYNTQNKGEGQLYLALSGDSARIYVDEEAGKGAKGGFAVGGYNTVSKGVGQTFLSISPDSARIYVNDNQVKGPKGGFAVGGYNSLSKSGVQEYLRVTEDSTRVYVNTDASKGPKGGFAVGGYSTGTKDGEGAFMRLTKENYFIGHKAGEKIRAGLYNSILGYESGLNLIEGNQNVFLGYQSGYYNNNGSSNAFLGYQSGYNNIGGNGNLFLGYQSGFTNVWGGDNTFVGYQAGYTNTIGPKNTFIGSFAGYSNTMGGLNTFVGDSAGFNNTTGYANTIMGTNAGYSNTTGYSNVFIGNHAGFASDSGGFNVFIGHESGISNVNAGSSVIIGSWAGHNLKTGWSNIMIGTAAGGSMEDGWANVFVGDEAGRFTKEGIRNVFLGTSAGKYELGSDKLYIANSEADSSGALIWGDFGQGQLRFNNHVGIGMQPSWNALSVNKPGDCGTVSIYGDGNPYDYSALELNGSENDSTRYIFSNGINKNFKLSHMVGSAWRPIMNIDTLGNFAFNESGSSQTMRIADRDGMAELLLEGVGNEWDYAALTLQSRGTTQTSYGMVHSLNKEFLIKHWNGTDTYPRLKIHEDGKIIINSWDIPSEVLDVEGNARFRQVGTGVAANDLWITSDGTLTTSTSDARLKEDVRPILNSLDKVLKLEGVSFNWKNNEGGSRDAGLLAQEVAEIFPEAVFQNSVDGFYGVNYSRFPALFVEAFKDQQEIIESQKHEIVIQGEEIADLKARLERLERLLVD